MKDYSKELTSEQKLVKTFTDPLNKRIEKLLVENKKLKKQLNLTDVVKPSLCELYDFGRQNKACEKKCNSCKWMEEQ